MIEFVQSRMFLAATSGGYTVLGIGLEDISAGLSCLASAVAIVAGLVAIFRKPKGKES